jgi:hypothetical protein
MSVAAAKRRRAARHDRGVKQLYGFARFAFCDRRGAA